MARRLCWSVLAGSIALNICFIGGVFYYKNTLGWSAVEEKLSLKAAIGRLGLQDSQLASLRELRRQVATKRQDLNATVDSVRGGFLQELTQPDLSEAAISDLLDRRNTVRRPYLVAIARDLHGFLQDLTPDQRQAFVELAEERGFLRQFLTSTND